MTDSEIRRKLKESPESGYMAIFSEYHSYVYTIVFHILRDIGSREDIEECAADVLSSVMLSYDTDREGSLKAYIGTTAKRKAIDLRRSLSLKYGKTVPIDSDDIHELPSAENVETAVENSELTRLLLEKIEKLGEPDSSIILHRYFFDRSSAETGRILGMNPITVRSRCRRALKRLKSELEL